MPLAPAAPRAGDDAVKGLSLPPQADTRLYT